MEFDSIAALWAMEGHGSYVWTCYGTFAIFLVGLMLWSRRQHRAVVNAQRREAVRPAARQAPAAASFTPVQPSRD